MPHLYDKAPPAFAKDPWAWDYTRDRLEGNTGIPYDQWEGKHFAGAAAMYKNVVKKYGDSMAAGVTTMPKECVDCGSVSPHYEGDYICQGCRDAIEAAPTFEAAAATISNPGSLDAIREQLYKSLGHDKKDAAKGRKVMTVPTPVLVAPVPTPEAVSGPPASMGVGVVGGKVSRNYKAMNPDKLQRSISELEAGEGEAMRKVKAGEDPFDHLEAALRAAQEKGL